VGLFDDVRCRYPLPNPAHQDLVYQTKDLDNSWDEYVITRRGRLVRETVGGPFEQRARRVACDIHKDVRIYTSIEVAKDEREWVEYVFRFTEGRVTRVHRSPDRGRYKVERYSPARRAAQPAPSEPISVPQTARQLKPALYPRRPTAAEFSDHIPEKLELIDGRIPGDDDLVLLLLTSLGLRHVAGLVNDPKLWRAAVARVRAPRPRPSRGSP